MHQWQLLVYSKKVMDSSLFYELHDLNFALYDILLLKYDDR